MSSEQLTHPWYTQTWLAVVALVLFFPLGLFLMWRFQRWEVWIKTVITVVVSLLAILIIVGAAIGGEDDDGEERVATQPTQAEEATEAPPVATATPTDTPPAETVTYGIAAREDVSFGTVIRIVYRVSVSGPLTEDDIRRIAQEIIDDETNQQDVNAIGFFFYLPGTGITAPYSGGAAFWAPEGVWANADTVRAGDYSKYELGAIVLGGSLGEFEFEPETTTGLSEDQRRTIFKELVASEDRADAEAYATYPDAVEEQNDLYWELLEEYKAEVRAKYGITEDQADEIEVEGVTQYWPRE